MNTLWPRCGKEMGVPKWMVVLAFAALVTCGCAVVRRESAATTSMLRSISKGRETGGQTNLLEAMQAAVMREADLYAGTVAQAADALRAQVPTTEARDLTQQWKLTQATAAYVNATGENPVLSVVDMLVLATLSRYVVEDYWVKEAFGPQAQPLLEVHRQLESNAWAVVQIVLTPTQQEDVRQLLQEYRQRFPQPHFMAIVRMPELASALGRLPMEEQSRRPESVFSLLYLNPLAGLDPTTRAIHQARLLAQRAMFYAQRMPMLLGWQVELTTFQLAAQPESRQMLSNVNDVAASTQVFARTAEGLTNLVNAQREAAINQVFDRLALARTNLLADLTEQETRLRGLLNETRMTLEAGGQMATSVNTSIQSLDAFVRSVSTPDTNATSSPPAPDSRPFDVLDYGKAATQIGAAATNLTTLLLTLNQSEDQATRLSRQATADAKDVLNHAFRLAAVLLLLLGLVQVGVVWAYRRARP